MHKAATLALGALLAGCAVGPTYHRPSVNVAPALGRAVGFGRCPRSAAHRRSGMRPVIPP
jgi:hypothetical protein